jgi:hypothetical protein
MLDEEGRKARQEKTNVQRPTSNFERPTKEDNAQPQFAFSSFDVGRWALGVGSSLSLLPET